MHAIRNLQSCPYQEWNGESVGSCRYFCLTLIEHFHVFYNLHDKCHMCTYSVHVYCILHNVYSVFVIVIGLLHSAQCDTGGSL